MNTINLSQETSDEIKLNKQGVDWLEMARTASKMAQKGKKNGSKRQKKMAQNGQFS